MMGSKKYKGRACVYCAREGASSEGDHIFAKKLFLKDKRDNLPQVPACKECNNKKSQLEHYLATVLPFGGQHADALDNLSLNSRRLEKNAVLRERLRSGIKKDWFETESGILVKSSGIPIDSGKLNALVNYIVRGLCWIHMEVQLLKEDSVEIIPVTKIGDDFFANQIFNLNVKKRIEMNLGNGTVSYLGVQGLDDPKLTVWRLQIYGGIQFGNSKNGEIARSSAFVILTADKREAKILSDQ